MSKRSTLPASVWQTDTLLIRGLHQSAASDGGGMLAFIVPRDPIPSRIESIARAYGVGRERLVVVSPSEAAALPHLCSAGGLAALLLVDARAEDADAVRARAATCLAGRG